MAAAETLEQLLQEKNDLNEERRRDIFELEQKLEGLNHYEVLGLPLGAGGEEVRKAFVELTRKYHPDRFFGRNLGSFAARIEKIYRRMTEAAHVLGDNQKRLAYLSSTPDLYAGKKRALADAEEIQKARQVERRERFRKHPFLAVAFTSATRMKDLLREGREALTAEAHGQVLEIITEAESIDGKHPELQKLRLEFKHALDVERCRGQLAEAKNLERDGNFPKALSALQRAVSADHSSGEAHYHLARLTFRDASHAKDAAKFAKRAVDLAPEVAEYHLLLARIYEKIGKKPLAKAQYEEVTRIDPDNSEAKKKIGEG